MSENGGEEPEIEVKDFFFKQMRKLRAFKSPSDLITTRASLVAVSNQYGVIYVAGDNTTIKAIKVETLERVFVEVQGSLQVEEENFPFDPIDVGCPFSHIALSCDDLTLAICFERDGSSILGFYDVRAFFSAKSPKSMFCEVVLSSGNDVKVRDIAWSPALCNSIAVLLTNGHMLMVQLNDIVANIVGTLQGSVTAVSWSPKGKQIVAGCKSGCLIQLIPNMQQKKNIPAPDIFSKPCEVSDLVWISTFQFGVVFTERDDDNDEMPSLVFITTSKTAPATYAKFEDVYYGMDAERETCFYLNYIAEWKLVLSIYADAYEVVTVGQTDKGAWVKWSLPDAARAVLPTTHNHDETYPLGLALAYTAVQTIKQDDQTFPPAPILILLSTDGVLCPFYLVNKNPAVPNNLLKPAQPLTLDGERLGPISSTMRGKTQLRIQGDEGFKSLSSTSVTSSVAPLVALQTTAPPITVQPNSLPPVTDQQNSARPIAAQQASGPPIATQQASSPRIKTQQVSASPITTQQTSSPQITTPQLTPRPTSCVLMENKAPTSLTPAFRFKPPNATPAVSLALPSSTKGPPLSNSELMASSIGSPRPFLGGVTEERPTNINRMESTLRATGTANIGASNNTSSTRNAGGQSDADRPSISEDNSRRSNSLTKVQAGVPKEKMPSNQHSPSKQQLLEATFHKHIHKEVEAFEKEMKELRNRVNEMKKLDNILRDINSTGISRQVANDTQYMDEVKSKVEELNEDVHEVKITVLEAFELLEDAKIRHNRGADPRYRHLLKGRGLDPSSERKMKEIRSFYMTLDNTLREVNMALDEKWEKGNKQARILQTPSLDFIYQAMRKNQNIAKSQLVQLETISNRVKNRSFYQRRWDRRAVGSTHDSDDVTSISESLRNQKLHLTLPTSGSVPARKQSELRNILSKRTSVPVRKTTFISDRRTRNGSSDAFNDLDSFSDEGSEKEEKKVHVDEKAATKEAPRQEKILNDKSLKARSFAYQADMTARSKQKDASGKKELLFPTTTFARPSMPTKDSVEKTPFPPQTAVPKANFSGASLLRGKSGQPLTSTPVPSFVKVTMPESVDKTPRDAAAAAALARAGGSFKSKLDSGAAIPAKTMVEHKAKDKKMASTVKDPKAEFNARLIADAAVKDAAKKMINVTQIPPSNQGTTFTLRSSSSSAQSAGPPVIVVQPGEVFGGKTPTHNPLLTGTQNRMKSVTETQPNTSSPFALRFEKPIARLMEPTPVSGQITSLVVQNQFFSFQQSFGDQNQAAPGSGGKPFVPVSQSPSRIQAAGGGDPDVVKKTLDTVADASSPSNLGSSSDRGKENVTRNLLEKTALAEEKPPDVDVRGEPEGESKQPVTMKATGPRQAAIGKSDKDSSIPSGIVSGGLIQTALPTASATDASKAFSQSLLTGFTSPFQASSPFVFGGGTLKPGFSNLGTVSTLPTTTVQSTTATTTPLSSGSQAVNTTGSMPSVRSSAISTSVSSQPPNRLEAVGSLQVITRSAFNGPPTTTVSLPNPTQTPSSPIPLQASAASPEQLSSGSPFTAKVPVVVTPDQTPERPSSFTPTGITPTKGEPSEIVTNEPTLEVSAKVQPSNFSLTTPNASGIGSHSSPSASPSPFKLESNLTTIPTDTPSVPSPIRTTSTGSPAASFQATQKLTQAGTFPDSPFSAAPRTTGPGFGGGLSGLGGAPQDPNRNPFAVSPSSQVNEPNLFGTPGGMSNPNPFQTPVSKPAVGTGFAGAAPTFGSSPMFGGNPSFGGAPAFGGPPAFGGTPTFGGTPSFGSSPTFGGTPSFGGAPTFGGAPAFASGVRASMFGGSPGFGSSGNSPERVFGSGTETSAMFRSSTGPTFGSLSAQSNMPSFGGLASGQTGADMGGSPEFNSSMSSTGPTFGSLSAQSNMPSFGGLASGQTGADMGGSPEFNSSMSSSSFSSYR